MIDLAFLVGSLSRRQRLARRGRLPASDVVHSLLFPLNVAIIVRFVILDARVSEVATVHAPTGHINARPQFTHPPCSTRDGVCLAPSTGTRSSTGTYSRFDGPT